MLKRLFAAAALIALSIPAAMAQDGFRSPTGNIHCQFYADGDGGATMRCDVAQISNRPPPRPQACDLDWGHAFEISARATRGTRLCYGDTVQDNRLPVLAYGRTWQRGGINCTSQQTGVTCRNTRGAGFTLSRASQSVF